MFKLRIFLSKYKELRKLCLIKKVRRTIRKLRTVQSKNRIMLYLFLIIMGMLFHFATSLIDFNEYEGVDSDYLQSKTTWEQIKDFLRSERR